MTLKAYIDERVDGDTLQLHRELTATKRQLETALDELKVRTLERDVAQAEAATLERLRDHAIEELKICRNWRPQ
jgi:hypothetical protein